MIVNCVLCVSMCVQILSLSVRLIFIVFIGIILIILIYFFLGMVVRGIIVVSIIGTFVVECRVVLDFVCASLNRTQISPCIALGFGSFCAKKTTDLREGEREKNKHTN